MKFLLTGICLVSGLVALAQRATENKIALIRAAVGKINKGSGYTIKKLSEEDFSENTTDNGGDLKGYFKDGQLVKIVEWVGLSSCVEITEYYIDSNKLIFVYDKGSQSPYSDSLKTLDYTKVEVTMECRFYFENGKVIKSILKGSTRCGGEPTAANAKGYLEDYARYWKLFSKK